MVTMSSKRDYYEVLGVAREANAKEIADAYRKLAIKNHPDKNPGDEEAIVRFKECAAAFEVLGDTDKRARYDRFGHAGVDGAGGSQFTDVNDIFEAFGDIFGGGGFGDLFGGSRAASSSREGRRRWLRSAARSFGSSPRSYEIGRVRAPRKMFRLQRLGRQARQQAAAVQVLRWAGPGGASDRLLPRANDVSRLPRLGRGREGPCGNLCRGSGFVGKQVRRDVIIPAGVDHQMRVRLSGEGEPSPDGGPPGDCYCLIHIDEHPLFQPRTGKI